MPHEEIWEEYRTAAEVAEAIHEMKVRGAPAIGASAAYAIALEAKRSINLTKTEFHQHLQIEMDRLYRSRPTAVNLAWAISRMAKVLIEHRDEATENLSAQLIREAEQIADEDIQTNRQIGKHGAALFTNQAKLNILTHCNTGSLATVDYGTALGVIRTLHAQGKIERVFVDETRPYLQGARLTAYELKNEGICHTLITDSMAAFAMVENRIDGIVVGADRIAANGDTANKIGTYSLAILAKYHHIPFYVAAPKSTFDLQIDNGSQIPIETRNTEEITHWEGSPVAPVGTMAWHPAFDVTPAKLITGIITETGVIHNPDYIKIKKHFQ